MLRIVIAILARVFVLSSETGGQLVTFLCSLTKGRTKNESIIAISRFVLEFAREFFRVIDIN